MVDRKSLGLLLLAGAAFAVYAYTQVVPPPPPPPPPGTKAKAVAAFITRSGEYTASASYGFTDDRRLSTIISPQDGTVTPVAIEAVKDGAFLGKHTWSVEATGYNYIMEGGMPTAEDVGHHTLYTITTLADGRTVKSNSVTEDISSTPTPGPGSEKIVVTGPYLAYRLADYTASVSGAIPGNRLRLFVTDSGGGVTVITPDHLADSSGHAAIKFSLSSFPIGITTITVIDVSPGSGLSGSLTVLLGIF